MINKIQHLLNLQEQRFVMVGGLQGSGKSTIVKEFEAAGYKVVCPDRLRVELAQKIEGNEGKLEGEFDNGVLQEMSKKVFGFMPRMLKDYLAKGHSVVYDATNLTIKARKQVRQWATEAKMPVIAVYLECPLEIALQRNLTRSTTSIGTNAKGEPVYGRYVPSHVIELKALSQVLPTQTEGFKEVYILHVNAEKTYPYGKSFFEKLQLSNDLEATLTDLYNEGSLEKVLPTFAKTWNLDQQNQNHKLALHLHMIEAAKYLQKDSLALFIAGLLHDVGKLSTKKFYAKFIKDTQLFKAGEKVEIKTVSDRVGFLSARKLDYEGERQELTNATEVELDPNAHYYEHHVVGAVIARRELSQLGLEEELLNEIYEYVLYHMDLPFQQVSSKKAIIKLIEKVGVRNVKAMIRLREADKTASGTGEVYFDTIHNETVKLIEEVIAEKGWQ